MYTFEVEPAVRGATYIDALQMISTEDGLPIAFDPGDVLTWRLSPIAPGRGLGLFWPGYDYGFVPVSAPFFPALVTLTVGAGLIVAPIGTVQWTLNEGQTLQLRRPEYRMRLDVCRYGQTTTVLDTMLPVMD